MFDIDAKAPRVEVDEIRLLDRAERDTLLEGAAEICESIQDNDSEIWKLTRGGQFLRFTGVEGERAYVTDAAFARSFLDGFCEDSVMATLDEAGAFGAEGLSPK